MLQTCVTSNLVHLFVLTFEMINSKQSLLNWPCFRCLETMQTLFSAKELTRV